ncbi:MAG: HAD-IB family phosphatase [Candidatus Bathyarchaeota archaeon]|nr:HAD-IB family phosphatase [Candidatus Bathyarchaeota archaeon]
MDNGKQVTSEVKRLVVFDVEGVLIPKNRYLLFEISRKLGFFGFIRIVVLGFLYEVGLLALDSALKRIFVMLKGFKAKEVFELHQNMPLIPGTEQVFETLNKNGYKTALISSGLPTQVVQDFATRLNADYAYGLELEINDGHLTGEISGDVIKKGGKAVVLKRLLEKENLTPKDCIMVADDRNNLAMFPYCNLKIGYNPDFVLTAKSDYVTRKELTEILPPITGQEPSPPQASISKSRGLREAIHMSSFLSTFVCIYITGNTLAASLILLVALLYGISEVARVRGINIPVLSEITWNAANKTELYEFATAPIHFAIGIAVSLLVFPAPICYVAVAVLTLGDGGAHIFGMKFGRTQIPYNKGKNLEGTLCGLLFAFLGSLIFVDPTRALIAAAFGMLIESLPLPIKDNLTMPLASGLLLYLIS